MDTPRLLRAIGALCLAVVASLQPAQASDHFALHGYGHVTFQHDRDSDRPHEQVEHDLSLLGTWSLTSSAKLWLQAAHLSEAGARVDWVFGSLDLGAETTLYVGQARLPLGLYNELRDVQALRATATLPMLYDEELGLADEALRGAMLEFRHGALTYEGWLAGAMVPDAEAARTGRMAGGRLTWQPDGSAWMHKVSAYSGRLNMDGGHVHKHAVVVSTRLDLGDWALQAEAGTARLGDHRLTLGYLQADRALWPDWRGTLRLDLGRSRDDEDAHRARSLTLALAWRPDPQWGLRLEWSHRRGRLHDDGAETHGAETRDVWNRAAVSVNFMF